MLTELFGQRIDGLVYRDGKMLPPLRFSAILIQPAR